MNHPAKFSDSFLPLFAHIILKYKIKTVLDPFAGTGKIVKIKKLGFTGNIICNDLEREWKKYDADWYFVDAEFLSIKTDCICTSPTYGNRLADHHNARDKSIRNSYKHNLGRDLTPGNTGTLYFGKKYQDKHERIYKNLISNLEMGGIFILNVSDFISKGKIVHVSNWHKKTISSLGLSLVEEYLAKSKRLLFGGNTERVDGERIFVFKKTQKPLNIRVPVVTFNQSLLKFNMMELF